MIVYLESSAVVKLIVNEAESDALAAWLESTSDAISIVLTETEVRRSAHRLGINQAAASDALNHLSLFELTRSDYSSAGLMARRDLRSLDALHLAAALRLGVDCFVTYDARQSAAATELGLTVASPA